MPSAALPRAAARVRPPRRSRPLRAWQRQALAAYRTAAPRDFLAVATPGAGKTAFALAVAKGLLADGVVQGLTVVTPTEHLKGQWAAAAAEIGVELDPTYRNSAGAASASYHGVVVTYAQVAAHPALHEARTRARRTLVVLDEVHHAGDARSWGDAARAAFGPATRRLSLTGTPFRSDTNPIPFVTYAREADGSLRSAPDSSYGYGEALRDGVVRPVIFLAYSGETSWRTSAGDVVAVTLGEPLTPDLVARAWRTALDPGGDWVPTVLAAADRRLSEVRAGGMPDAGGLVIAGDHEKARAYAALLRTVTGSAPALVLSDDPGASRRIAAFGASTERWMVAVRMVSEGVDIPRLAVGVYATPTSTPLFFAQAVGRFVRARRAGETASVFLPSVPVLLGLAAELEADRDHVLQRATAAGEDDLLAVEDRLIAAANRSGDSPDGEAAGVVMLGASAHFDQVLFDGASYGAGGGGPGSVEEEDYLGLPGLLLPDQVVSLLSRRQAQQLARPAGAVGSAAVGSAAAGSGEPRAEAAHLRLARLRRELQGLVGAWHHRTGASHGSIHAELRRASGGPAAAQATEEQLRARVDALRAWAAARRPAPR